MKPFGAGVSAGHIIDAMYEKASSFEFPVQPNIAFGMIVQVSC